MTSDTRPSTLARPVLDVERLATALLSLRWYSAEGIEDARIVAREIVREYSRLLRPKVAPESAPLEGIEQYQAESR